METHLLKDLAVVMAIAGAMTLFCHRLRQPVVIGYLIAGLITGPFTPPFSFISNLNNIHTMAELGLVFLLFSLGLEFNLPKIRKVGLSAGLAAILEVILMLGIGYWLGQAFGWRKLDSVFLGAILSMSSTTIIVKVLMDFKLMQEKFAQVVFGILILEDIVAVAFLSILSGLGAQQGPDARAVVSSFVRIILFITIFLIVGLLFIPKFVHWVSKYNAKEVLGIVTLGLCLGGAAVAARFDLSTALGAFLTGAVLAASKELHAIEEWMHPVRDMFSALFFVSAGMLIQPQLLWEHRFPIAVVTLVTMVGKIFSGACGSYLAGYDLKTSAKVGMSLAQIGEFSFVIASLGIALNVTSNFLYPLAIAVSSLTTLATPYLIRHSDKITTGILSVTPAPIHQWLDNYSLRIGKFAEARKQDHSTAIFSKYLVRLGIYGALLISLLMTIRAITRTISGGATVSAAWMAAGILSMPLFFNISKYSNHIILLLVSRSKTLLRRINVHFFYNTLNAGTVLGLGAVFLFLAASHLPRPGVLTLIGAIMLAVGFFFRRLVLVVREWLERLLDIVAGLATSEPTRQAILTSGERTLSFVDMTDQIALPRDSFAHHKKIRDIHLREQSGASIVAIYRDGRHIPNPGPDEELLPDDVLVLLGGAADLEKARGLLLP